MIVIHANVNNFMHTALALLLKLKRVLEEEDPEINGTIGEPFILGFDFGYVKVFFTKYEIMKVFDSHKKVYQDRASSNV